MYPDGALVLAATPIGSSRDASPALAQLLRDADIVAAEDTRRAVTLLRRIGVSAQGTIISYFEGNESARTQEIVDAVLAGKTVALVTDAGMPSVSDPGFRAVRACIDSGARVTALPGPCAAVTALALSGLPTDRFCFEGFVPRKHGERAARLKELASERRTMIFFEAPHRLHEFLTDAAAAFGADRRAAVCRELTKPHEEVIRDSLEALTQWATDDVRGEITVVIDGAQLPVTSTEDALVLVQRRIADGEKLSSAVSEVATATGIPRKPLYEAALAAKKAT